MRFTSVLLAISSVAGAVGAFQDVNDRSTVNIVDNNAYDTAAITLVAAQHNARAPVKGRTKATDKKAAATTTDKKVAAATSTTKMSATTSTTKMSTATSSTASAATSTAALACSTKKPALRFMRRLNGEPLSKVSTITGSTWVVYEDKYIQAKAGQSVSVTDVSGCSAVFFWNAAKIPFAFHIFCGMEDRDGKASATIVGDFGFDPESVTIAARSTDAFNKIAAGIKTEFPDVTINNENYDDSLRTPKNTKRWKFDVTAGSTTVTRSLIDLAECSQQNQ